MNYWAMWLVVVILLTILEFATVNLVSVWFIASGIFSLILSLFVDNLAWQFGVFVVLGILLMVFAKPLLSKISNKEVEKLNLERVIGMPGIVTQEIKSGRVGEVKVDGKTWSATSLEDLEVDTMILVEKMDGEKLCVVRNEPDVVELPPEIEIPEEKNEEIPSQEVETTLEEGTTEEKGEEISSQEVETALEKGTTEKKSEEIPSQEVETTLEEETHEEPLDKEEPVVKENKEEKKPSTKKKSSSKRKRSSKKKSSNKSQNNHQ